MDVRLSETQEMLRASARDFLAESCPTKEVRAARTSPEGFSRELWSSIAGLGWAGLALPERCGGSGMEFVDLCLLIEEMGYACMPSPFVDTVAGCALTLASAGRDEADRLATLIGEGDSIVVPACQPAGDGNEAILRHDGSDYALNGTELFVPFADSANHLLVTARAKGDTAREYMVVVPADARGIHFTPMTSMGDQRPHAVRFESVTVHGNAILFDGQAATEARRRMLGRIDVARCCDVVGALQWVLDDTVAYAKERKQFGKPIGEFQSLQHYCADIRIMLDGLRTASYHAAWQLGQDCDADPSIAVACAYAHRVVPQVMAMAHQIHGAMGVTREHDLHLYTTHAFAPARVLAPVETYRDVVLHS